jgi:hypothetical protein
MWRIMTIYAPQVISENSQLSLSPLFKSVEHRASFIFGSSEGMKNRAHQRYRQVCFHHGAKSTGDLEASSRKKITAGPHIV